MIAADYLKRIAAWSRELTEQEIEIARAGISEKSYRANEFIFKVNGQKHTFQAANAAERDSWFVALEAKAAEAKAEKETIVASEGYKAELEKLSK